MKARSSLFRFVVPAGLTLLVFALLVPVKTQAGDCEDRCREQYRGWDITCAGMAEVEPAPLCRRQALEILGQCQAECAREASDGNGSGTPSIADGDAGRSLPMGEDFTGSGAGLPGDDRPGPSPSGGAD
ncbi:MAG: hypothetical protein IT285_13040 [Bdellovibrionales bacterium]|nr:hypothetical protein [Bdellovibrionales bacterium]